MARRMVSAMKNNSASQFGEPVIAGILGGKQLGI